MAGSDLLIELSESAALAQSELAANGKTEKSGHMNESDALELAAYDSDGNGWIDEDDPVYGQLRIWTDRASEGDVLRTFKECDVGAIYMRSVYSPFSLMSHEGVHQGQPEKTGIYLKESGSAGAVQQIDIFA